MRPEFDMGTALESLEELMGMGLLEMFLSDLPTTLINLAVYIFTGLGLYTIAKRRGIHNPWLAWIPYANTWLLGCISDHYRHTVRREVKSRRKVLLGTEITVSVIGVVISVLCFKMLFSILAVGLENLEYMDEAMAQKLLVAISGPGVVMMLLMLPLLVVAIVHLVFYLIALHDIYKSCDPGNATLYLVLGIFFSFAVPIFLMVCRNKDGGMLPQQPAFYQTPASPTAYRPSGYMVTAQPQEPQQADVPTWHSVQNVQPQQPTYQPPVQPEPPVYQPPVEPVEPWEQKNEQ